MDVLTNRVPDVPGGGTVMYVNPTEHRYLDDAAHREEGGTPAIIESIRAGLVFQLKEEVGVDVIAAQEDRLLARALAAWSAEPTIEILGNTQAKRLSIVSFVIRTPQGAYLHHNFVVALLNDLFGIQTRGGCSCAGPYGHRLLGIDLARSHAFERQIATGCEGIKPGWVRVNFNYFLDERITDYTIDAVAMVARDGWRLLAHYRFDPLTGLWHHRAGSAAHAAPGAPAALLGEPGALFPPGAPGDQPARPRGTVGRPRALDLGPPPALAGGRRPGGSAAAGR